MLWNELMISLAAEPARFPPLREYPIRELTEPPFPGGVAGDRVAHENELPWPELRDGERRMKTSALNPWPLSSSSPK